MKKVCEGPVMIIDDNEIDIFINRKVLEFSDFTDETICLNSANEALKHLSEGGKVPKMIFLDLNMPVIDGFRFLYEFSKMPKEFTSQINIVVLTSSDNDHDKEKVAANPYVMEFVSKPLTEQKLQKISEQLGKLEMVAD